MPEEQNDIEEYIPSPLELLIIDWMKEKIGINED